MGSEEKSLYNIEKLNIGIAGVAGGFRSFLSAIEANKTMRLRAVCDLNQESMAMVVPTISS